MKVQYFCNECWNLERLQAVRVWKLLRVHKPARVRKSAGAGKTARAQKAENSRVSNPARVWKPGRVPSGRSQKTRFKKMAHNIIKLGEQ